ncbi:MAG: hypothetical protein ABIJ86_07820, partial [Spirochaetota bacterium]
CVAWSKVHSEFRTAYLRAKELQKTVLIENGTAGLYQAQFTIFVAKNCTDMRDVTASEISGPGGGPIAIRATELTDEELLDIARRGSSRAIAPPALTE